MGVTSPLHSLNVPREIDRSEIELKCCIVARRLNPSDGPANVANRTTPTPTARSMSIFQPLPELGNELRDLAGLVEHAEKFGDQFVLPESGAGFLAHGDGSLFVT